MMNAETMVMNDTQTAIRNGFVERIKSLWHRSREAIIAIGQALIEAKSQLPRGEFTSMIERELPFKADTARQFMRIAADPLISNHDTCHALPESAAALDQLRKLPPKAFNEAVQAGIISPDMTVREACALASAHCTQPPISGDEQRKSTSQPREPVHVDARKPNDLKLPVIGPTDYLATLKGYRQALHLSQNEVDAGSGRDGWNYYSKQEINIRAMITDEAWTTLAAMALAMIIVPAADCCSGKCPVCGR